MTRGARAGYTAMMTRSRSLLTVLAAALAACGDSTGPADDLARNRALWQAEGSADYEFGFQRFCFCPEEAVRHVQIRVTAGAVVSVIDAQGQPVDSLAAARWFTFTIDSLFGVVEHAIAVDAHRLTVRYDPEFGYPESIAVDYDAATVDEEMLYSAHLLIPLSIP